MVLGPGASTLGVRLQELEATRSCLETEPPAATRVSTVLWMGLRL